MAKRQEKTDNLQVLKQAIRSKDPGRLYFFYGEETFLLHHYLQQLRKVIVDEVTESFNYHKLTAENFDMRDFTDCVENLPMMAARTMVVVDEVDPFKLHEGDREAMVQILADIPDYCTVIFTYETTPFKPDKRMAKLWNAIEKNGELVEFEKQNQRDLVTWISRHFAANQKRITPELCIYLIDITDGTMTSLAGEISKISAYAGTDVICKSDIDAVTEPVLDAVAFQMTDMISRGDGGMALVKLQQLIKLQQEPLVILGAIGSHFRRMATARIVLDGGKHIAELIRLTGMKESYARKMISAAPRFSARFYALAAELVLETDRQIKTSVDSPERLLEILILKLSQEVRND